MNYREHGVGSVDETAAEHVVKFFESERNIARLEYQEYLQMVLPCLKP